MNRSSILELAKLDEYIMYKSNRYESGMHAVPKPPIDHKYVRDLEDRVAYLEKSMKIDQEKYNFLYPFAARHIIQIQLGKEQSAVQELLDSLEVMAVLTEPTYQAGVDVVLKYDHFAALQRMVNDWNIKDKG